MKTTHVAALWQHPWHSQCVNMQCKSCSLYTAMVKHGTRETLDECLLGGPVKMTPCGFLGGDPCHNLIMKLKTMKIKIFGLREDFTKYASNENYWLYSTRSTLYMECNNRIIGTSPTGRYIPGGQPTQVAASTGNLYCMQPKLAFGGRTYSPSNRLLSMPYCALSV